MWDYVGALFFLLVETANSLQPKQKASWFLDSQTSPLAGKLPFRKGSGTQPHSSGQSLSLQAQELDVARQEGKAGKGAEDGASCAKSLLLVGSFCWKGWREPRLEAKSCIRLLGGGMGA